MTHQDIFTTELETRRREGAHLIDVRESDEYLAGHIPGAVNLPMSTLVGREDEVPTPAVLICASGNRSSQAAAHLAGQGRTDLMNLSGGTLAWKREGRELNLGSRP